MFEVSSSGAHRAGCVAAAVVAMGMLADPAWSQPPRGRVTSRNAGGVPAPAVTPVIDNTAQLELGQYQQIREEALQSMEQTLQQRAAFQTAQRRVDSRMMGLQPPPPAVPQRLTGIVTAVNNFVALKRQIDANPSAVINNIPQIVTEFDNALKNLETLKKDNAKQLATDLLQIAITTLDSAVAAEVDTTVLLPALLSHFSDRLGLTPILKTLTKDTSSDTIWLFSTCLMILNALFHDYTSSSMTIQ